jgi:hypothetical protein
MNDDEELAHTIAALFQTEQPKEDATDVEAAANYEAPNRYQEYGLDVHKAFVGGAIFGAEYRTNQANGHTCAIPDCDRG